ncbi:MAG: hypothetical protein QOI98_156 [Solirubrobacteraceae bacterium]|jgi:hypothetical protein|nr:hypothetical protein [Solirubrobacteraceae bacterium]
MRRAHRERSAGQATVETVALLPLLAVVAFAAAQLLAAGIMGVLADHAAEAGAVAILEGGDPGAAAREALPGWSRGGMALSVSGRHVEVRLRPPSPIRALADLLAAEADADAGPGGDGRS